MIHPNQKTENKKTIPFHANNNKKRGIFFELWSNKKETETEKKVSIQFWSIRKEETEMAKKIFILFPNIEIEKDISNYQCCNNSFVEIETNRTDPRKKGKKKSIMLSLLQCSQKKKKRMLFSFLAFVVSISIIWG